MNEKVLIVDDERSIVDPIAYALKKEGYITDSADNGKDALTKFASFKPDLILLDEMMPELDGYGVLRKLENRGPVGVIMLTAKDDIVDKVLGLELGADDYLTKPFDMRELLARVRTLLRRLKRPAEDADGNDTLILGGVQIDTAKRKVIVENKTLELTPKEFDLIALLCSNPERVYTREQLLDAVWGMDYFGGTRTVDIHVLRLRKKLGQTYQDILKTIHGIGYCARVGSE